jgi:hypothetical protein
MSGLKFLTEAHEAGTSAKDRIRFEWNVEKCSVADDIPAIPSETKTNTAPSPTPK